MAKRSDKSKNREKWYTNENDELNQLRHENAELRRRVEVYEESQEAYAGGAIETIARLQERLLEAKRERDEAREQASSLEKEKNTNEAIYAELLPMNTITFGLLPDPGLNGEKTINTAVGVSAWFSDGYGVGYAVWEDVFQGDIKTAQQEIKQAIRYALSRTPTETDIGKQSIPGLSKQDIQNICQELRFYRYLFPNKYEEKRLAAFERYWPQIDMNGETDRNSARNRFNNVIDRTFEAREKRIGGLPKTHKRKATRGKTNFVLDMTP